jgi:hypothetical protein
VGTAASYRQGETLRSRSVSDLVLHGRMTVPAPPKRLVLDWQREVASNPHLHAGDVEALPLARARARWPDFRQCVQAAADWTEGRGLMGILRKSDIALMACRGAKLHHDGEQYGAFAFCNLFLSEDRGLDLQFVNTGLRIPLMRGTVVIFDTYQAHEVVARSSDRFVASDFPDAKDLTQVFLTWELPIRNPQLAQLLQIQFDTSTSLAAD